MFFPANRPRRLRKNENFRRMIRETKLSVDDLVYPLFVTGGKNVKKPISAMPRKLPDVRDQIVREVKATKEMGIPAILLFGLPAKKDERGSGAYARDGIIQRAVSEIKEKVPTSWSSRTSAFVSTRVTATADDQKRRGGKRHHPGYPGRDGRIAGEGPVPTWWPRRHDGRSGPGHP